MYYFGYGSNMLTARLCARIPSAKPVGTAILSGFGLRFHKRSRDGSAKCNVVPVPPCTVHGVLYDVNSANLDALDAAEQRGHGYERQTVTVHRETGRTDAFVYLAQPAYVDDALRPYEWYLRLVVAGAREHALPTWYVAQLMARRSSPDPSRERREEHDALLRQARFSPDAYRPDP